MDYELWINWMLWQLCVNAKLRTLNCFIGRKHCVPTVNRLRTLRYTLKKLQVFLMFLKANSKL